MLKDRLPDSYIVQEGTALGFLMGTPVYIDTTDDSNIYLGYCKLTKELTKSEILLICKVNINGTIITKTFSYGKWEDRATLEYK